MHNHSSPHTFARIVRVIGLRNLALCFSIASMMIFMALRYEYFLTWGNMRVTAMAFVLEAIIALGMTLVIISGGIDLSVSAVLPFSAILTGLALIGGFPIPLAIVAVLCVGAIIGAVNGALSNWLRVHPFIITLATMLTLKGICLVMTGGGTLSGFPPAFTWLGQGTIVGVPMPLILFSTLAAALAWLLSHHRFFRQVYFVGGNPRAAALSGIRVERFLVVMYAISGTLAALAGIVAAAQYGTANNTFGQNAELRVITAVVIGGASLYGGLGTVAGTLLGVAFLAVVQNAFVMTGVSSYWQDVVNGGMLLLAVFLSEFVMKRERASARVGVTEMIRC